MADDAQPGRDALDGALSGIGAPLEQYLAAPGDMAALDAARSGLHRLLDLLKAARLSGAATFCAELTAVLDELSSQPDMLSDLHRGALQQALPALARHLHALAGGADDAALRLFAEYQALQQLRGLEASFDLDLFHPDLDVQLPQRILDMSREDDTLRQLKALRAHYEEGLLHWLRKDDAPAALQAMQKALEGAMRCMPQDSSRAFWWVACGLIDCLRLDKLPAVPNASRLLGRIDQRMRVASSAEQGAAAERDGSEVQALLDEMLYLIGRSDAASDLTEEIRQVYALEFYLPGLAVLPPDKAAQILDAMRGALLLAEENLEHCAHGNRTACEGFIHHAGQLAANAGKLGRNALQYLAGQIFASVQQTDDPEQVRLIALDMAMALLLLGIGIHHYGKLSSKFLREARILTARMQTALRQQPEDTRQLAELVQLHSLLQRDDVNVHLYNEMLANLQYVEQGMRAFFGDPARRNELNELLRLSGQIRGGLHIASLELAERLLDAIAGGIRRFAQSDDMPEPADSHALSGAVDALQDYLRHLARSEACDAATLQVALGEMAGLRQAAAAPEPSRAVEIPRPASEDQELLEVFLEEAQEVLHALRNDLEACGVRMEREPLVNIRRGFHTLKGSGRMVGLTDLGEVAWNVERALNKWLQDNRPPTPGLLRFIADAERRFSGWVDALNSQGGVIIEAADLSAAAQQVESGIEPGEAAEQPMEEPEVPPEKEAAPPPVQAEEAAAPTPSPAVTAASAAAEKPPVHDEIDAQLLSVFLDEADELCPRIGAGLRAWREQPGDEQQAQLLEQLLHTLKGSARMAGAMQLGSMVHRMEEQVLSARGYAGNELLDTLEGSLDRVAGLIGKLRSAASTAEQRVPEGGAMLRVRTDIVDRLAIEAGEISLARARMEAEMHTFKEGLQELSGSVARLRRQLREIEMQSESRIQARFGERAGEAQQFDPLEFDRFTRLQELTRFMNESVHDVQTVQQALQKNFDTTAAALATQKRLNRELQQNLMNARMVPLSSIAERLHRIVRQTAKELNKRANLDLLGAEVELDRSVLERMTAPFEHLLRNALVHGIEDEVTRVQGGKNHIGDIRLALHHEGNEVVFELSDDGAGLDYAALREKAVARGLLGADEAAGNERLTQLIFAPGVSTAAEVTEVAGRGIGMDIVRGEIAALGGRIAVSSQKGAGTRFTIHLPLTLAVTHVLMVRSGKENYAIPSSMVEQVRQVKPAELEHLYRSTRVEWQGRSYPLHYLPHLLGDVGRRPEEQKHNPLVLLHSGEQRIALHVDGLLGNQEAMVKNAGPQLAQLPAVAGAIVQGNGVVTLILNPAQLAQRIAAAVPAAAEQPTVKPLVMVVDDSLTVRKVTTRLLTRAGYRVATARDGIDALEQLGETLPDVMLLDIEMPRMDGFELTKHLRRDARTQKLPIVMITSRAADKHRDYALQLGVNAYLGKPYQEEELLQEIASFAPIAGAGTS